MNVDKRIKEIENKDYAHPLEKTNKLLKLLGEVIEYKDKKDKEVKT